MFSDARTPGVDVICPDIEYLMDDIEQGGGELLGLILTHGHEDHIGAVAHLWPFLKCPIYATPFTAELVNRKLEEAMIVSAQMNIVPMGGTLELGPFSLEYVTLTHSIPEPNGIILRTEFGTVLHTGDWKIDPQPTLGPKTDKSTLEELGKEGVLAMICDSTNVLSQGHSESEGKVSKSLEIDAMGVNL